ncbi:MAG: hypothetical protein R2878_02670 [Thermoleophilia bacterium]
MTDITRDRDDQHGPLPVGFTTHSFDDTIAPVYLETLSRLIEDTPARPGLTTLRTLVAERAAHAFARLKQMDSEPDVYPPDYHRAQGHFASSIAQLVKVAEENPDTVFQSMVARGMHRAALDAIGQAHEAGDLDDDVAENLIRGIGDALRAQADQGRL